MSDEPAGDSEPDAVARRGLLKTVGVATGVAGLGYGGLLAALGRGGERGTEPVVDLPRRITDPGRYRLVRDYRHAGDGPCVEIAADDVTFVGAGHAVRGGGDGTGVLVTGSNVTLRDLDARAFATGVRVEGATGGAVRNVTASENAADGVALVSAERTAVVNSEATENRERGIRIEATSDSEVRDSAARHNGVGIELADARDNRLLSNAVCDNLERDLAVDRASSGNVLRRNDTYCADAGATDTVLESTRITEPGLYRLTQDVTGSGEGPCIEVAAPNVTVDGMGNSLVGDQRGVGMLVTAPGATVRNLSVRRFRVGLRVEDTAGHRLENVTAEWNQQLGVHVDGSDDGRIVGSATRDNWDDGLLVEGARGNAVEGNTALRNRNGIVVRDGAGNRVVDNVARVSFDRNLVAPRAAVDDVAGNRTTAVSRLSGPGVVRRAGKYELTADVAFDGRGACIDVPADGVVIAGNGHTLRGDGRGTGLRVSGDDVTVRNLAVTGFETGVHATESTATTVDQVRAVGNAGDGIRVSDATGYRVTGCRSRGNGGAGVAVFHADEGAVRRNRVRRNRVGVEVRFARGTAVVQNEARENQSADVEVGPHSARTVDRENASGRDSPPGRLVIHRLHPDDATEGNENMEDEYVVLRNAGDEPLDLTGYGLVHRRPKPRVRFPFPEGFDLSAGGTVTVRTGHGDDTGSDLYVGAGPLLDNLHDSVAVVDDGGVTLTARRFRRWRIPPGLSWR